MARITWDKVGERFYETGVDHGVLFLPGNDGVYDNGFPWNGLTAVNETPSGAESNPQYADNIKYLNLVSAEEFGATIEAFTYPEEFAECDGTYMPTRGVAIGQQGRRLFGLAYRTLVGNDTRGTDFGYKIHLIYGAQAAPSEKSYQTVNESPEALTFSWEVSTTPVAVTGHKPAASLTINSTEVDPAALKTFEDILYGTDSTRPRMPLPDEVIEIFGGEDARIVPADPTFDQATNTITIPTTEGVNYQIAGQTVTGTRVITEDTTVTAVPSGDAPLDTTANDSWTFTYVAA